MWCCILYQVGGCFHPSTFSAQAQKMYYKYSDSGARVFGCKVNKFPNSVQSVKNLTARSHTIYNPDTPQ